MWRLYLKSNEGIAIKSTCDRFKRCFDATTEAIYIGQVTYIDYDKEEIRDGNLFAPILHKRKSFEHEREVRAVLWKPPCAPASLSAQTIEDGGVCGKVNLNTLVEEIRIAPSAPGWLKDLIRLSFRNLVTNFGSNNLDRTMRHYSR
jgi:hypothetical protein